MWNYESLRNYVVDAMRDVDGAARNHVRDSPGPDWKTMVVLLTTAIALVVQHYGFRGSEVDVVATMLQAIGATDSAAVVRGWITAPENRELSRLGFWITGQFVAYVVIPVPIVWFLFRESLEGYGVRWRNAFSGSWMYVAMLVFMLPVVWYCSTTEAFRSQYPFYRLRANEPLWPRFLVWEALYALQFVALEFFFRGFVLHGTKHRFGSMAIFVMMVPYCMIHFGKPMPETLGAIGAGLVLGFASLKTRSIWLGAGVHVGVAWSMDALALLGTR